MGERRPERGRLWLLLGSFGAGVVLGWLATWAAFNWTTPAFDPSIAWQGWTGSLLGAVLGALASIVVAVWVLRRTLHHEREQFGESLEAQRTLQLSDRRNAAWGDLVTALRQVQEATAGDLQEGGLAARVSAAVSVWSLYLTKVDSSIEKAVTYLVNSHVRDASSRGGASVRTLIDNLITNGTAWHRGGEEGQKVAKWFSTYAHG